MRERASAVGIPDIEIILVSSSGAAATTDGHERHGSAPFLQIPGEALSDPSQLSRPRR
jgi:hypothetical protein